MKYRWSSQRVISNSKIVKSSFIWLIIVPFAAKALSKLDDVIELTIFGGVFKFSTVLPFSWQLLFFAACFFTLAGIIYSIYCPEIVKFYKNYSQFEADGKTRKQINHAFKAITWDDPKSEFHEAYISDVEQFLRSYHKYSMENYRRDENEKEHRKLILFERSDLWTGDTNDAFYFVYSVSDMLRQGFIVASLALYICGFACILAIAIENIYYVAKTFG